MKKLILKRSTVRSLSSQHLHAAAGGTLGTLISAACAPKSLGRPCGFSDDLVNGCHTIGCGGLGGLPDLGGLGDICGISGITK